MKSEKRLEARKLRIDGLSLKEISEKIAVSKSSVSLWVRNIELTYEQKLKLNRIDSGRNIARNKAIKKGRESRSSMQNKGRELAKKHMTDKDFITGCIMYWAEGTKGKNTVAICNSDIDIQKLFINFLRKYFGVQNDSVSLFCRYYTDLSSQGEPEKYWIQQLELPESCLRKSCINYYPKDNTMVKKRYSHGKLKYGVISLRVNNTNIIQQIYGAIQELTGINKPEWA